MEKTVEDIVNSWKRETQDFGLSEIGEEILSLLHERAKIARRGIDFLEIAEAHILVEKEDLVKELLSLEDKRLIRRSNSNSYTISRKGVSAFRPNFEVYANILDRIVYGHSKGFKEVYLPYIAKGIELLNYGVVKSYLRDLAKENLVEQILRESYLNVKITDFGEDVYYYIRRNPELKGFIKFKRF